MGLDSKASRSPGAQPRPRVQGRGHHRPPGRPARRPWLDLLEASFAIFRLRPHHRNFRKRLVKSPKLYFYDTGLAARLLGIEEPRQLATHAMRGALFENWVIAELLKGRGNRGLSDNLFFWRTHTGHEIDVVAEQGGQAQAIEIKAGSTVASDWFDAIEKWGELAGPAATPPWLIYGGQERYHRRGAEVVPWTGVEELAERV